MERCSAVVRIPKISCTQPHDIGAFGEVRMCVHRDTGAQRAVKVLRKSHMDDDEKKMLFNEINILRELVSRAILSVNTRPNSQYSYMLINTPICIYKRGARNLTL